MVASHRLHFDSSDGLAIACARWEAVEPVRGVVQIAHGLGEHSGRYAELAAALAATGYVVYANDHRGHGLTAKASGSFGEFGPGGFDQLVADVVALNGIARRAHSQAPFVLFGHSMGSFASQQFVLDHSDRIDALVLSGSGALDGLARVAMGAQGGEWTDVVNAPFAPVRTSADWLSRDNAEVDRFLADPLCFPALRAQSMQSFLAASSHLADPAELARIRKDLSIYIFSGSEDPIGQATEGVRVLIDRYRRAGIGHIEHVFYPGGRHEMLHEVNRQEVIDGLVDWIDRVAAARVR